MNIIHAGARARRPLVPSCAVAVLVLATTAATPAEPSDEVVLAEGNIVIEAGDEAPATADVFAWPSNEALADIEVGDQFTLEPIGSAVVGADGAFEVVVDELGELDRLASEEGELNLFVSADNGEQSFDESFSVNLHDLQSGTVDDAAVVDLGEVAATGEVAHDSEVDPAAEAETYIEKSCTTTKVINHGNRWVPVGGLFSFNSGATVDYVYSAGQSSSLGASVSQKSSVAGFSASGTTSVSSTASINFPMMSGTGSKLAKTQFRYGTYKTRCTVWHTSGQSYTSTTYKTRADMWVGGASLTNVSAPGATYCVSYPKTSGFTKNKDKQVRWNGAVTIAGVGLSAQTGWSNDGKLSVNFPSKAGKICGSGNYATQPDAYQIVVKS